MKKKSEKKKAAKAEKPYADQSEAAVAIQHITRKTADIALDALDAAPWNTRQDIPASSVGDLAAAEIDERLGLGRSVCKRVEAETAEPAKPKKKGK